MFDLGWSEIALIAVVAFVLLGPQDLVRLMRKVGYWTQKARLTLVTYQRMLEAAAYDEDIRRMRKELGEVRHETAGLAAAMTQVPDGAAVLSADSGAGEGAPDAQKTYPGTGYRDVGRDI